MREGEGGGSGEEGGGGGGGERGGKKGKGGGGGERMEGWSEMSRRVDNSCWYDRVEGERVFNVEGLREIEEEGIHASTFGK